jgi:hypothetical protein
MERSTYATYIELCIFKRKQLHESCRNLERSIYAHRALYLQTEAALVDFMLKGLNSATPTAVRGLLTSSSEYT